MHVELLSQIVIAICALLTVRVFDEYLDITQTPAHTTDKKGQVELLVVHGGATLRGVINELCEHPQHTGQADSLKDKRMAIASWLWQATELAGKIFEETATSNRAAHRTRILDYMMQWNREIRRMPGVK